MLSCIGLVLVAQQIPNTPEYKEANPERAKFRGTIMDLHESIGILMLGAMVPRVALRLATKMPKKLPGPTWEHRLGQVSHGLLYGAIVFMPVSGLAFGYWSCWGVPFFWWQIPGCAKEDENKPLTDFFYNNHHRVGYWLEYLVAAHIAAVFFHHLVRKHALVQRMVPNRFLPKGMRLLPAPKP